MREYMKEMRAAATSSRRNGRAKKTTAHNGRTIQLSANDAGRVGRE